MTVNEVATASTGLLFAICAAWATVQLVIGGMSWAGRAGRGLT